MAENLKKILNIDGTDYNINAVYSDEAGKVTNPLIVKRSGESAFNFDGSVAGQTIDYVHTTGGTFSGKVYIDHTNAADKDLGSVTANELINYNQIKHLVSAVSQHPLYSWEDGQLAHLKNVHNGLSGLNVVVGTADDFKAFKRLMCVPDISSTNEETRYYGLRISSSTPYTEGHVDYRTRTNSTYKDVYLPSYGYYNELSTGIIDLSKGVPVTAIREEAFKGNKTIEMVVIPESITTIGSYAFQNCSALKSIKLPSKLERITTEVFNGCTSLKSIIIGKNVKKISREAFKSCSNLRTVYYEGTEDDWLAFNSVDTVTLADDTKQISNTGNTALTDVYLKSKAGEDGYNFVFNYTYTTEFIDLPCLYVCTDLGTDDLNIDNVNKMFLKMPNSGLFVELSRGATYLESTLTSSKESYTYEGLAEIIAKINKRLEAIGDTTLKIADSQVVNATIFDTSHALIPDDDFDIESVPTVQSLDARLSDVEDELAINEATTRLEAIEDGDTRVVKEARKVTNKLIIKLTDEAAIEDTDKFTYDGSQEKIVTIKTTDEDITLKRDLFTYTPIGKAQKASNEVIGSGATISNTNRGKLGSAGDSLKDVFDKVFGTQVDTQPTVSNNSALSVSAGTTSYGGGEYGTSVAANTVDITFTLANSGTANYGYKCGTTKTTGSQTFYYPITKQSGADIVITLPKNKTASVLSGGGSLITSGKSSGSTTNNILYCDFNSSKQVKIRISLPAGSVTTSSQTRYGQISASVTLGAAQKEDQLTAGTAITKFLTYLGDDATDTSKLSGGTKSNTAGAYTISAGSYYPYYLASTSTALSDDTDSPVTTATRFSSISSAVSISCTDASHIWFLLPPTTSGSKTIQYEPFANTWVTAFGGADDKTNGPVDVALKLNSGATVTYKGYYTTAKAGASSELNYKIV